MYIGSEPLGTTLNGTLKTSADLISTVGFFTNKGSQSDNERPQAKYPQIESHLKLMFSGVCMCLSQQ